MTQTELEQVAKHLRDVGLHSSWNELLVFADNVVGNLVDAYETTVRNSAASENTSPTPEGDALQDKLFKAIVSLTDEETADKWRFAISNGTDDKKATAHE